jgi:hypothetical protein
LARRRCFGLPGDSTYNNYKEANKRWRLTLLPLADKLLSAIAEVLETWFPDARLAIDLDASLRWPRIDRRCGARSMPPIS